MVVRTLRLPLDDVLPDVPSLDPCVARLTHTLCGQRGVLGAHVIRPHGRDRLCIHFDPATVTEGALAGIVEREGARLGGRYGHVVLPIRAVASEDAHRRIEARLGSLPGVLEVIVNLPAQRVRFEYDRKVTDEAALRAAIRRFNYDPERAHPAAHPLQRNRELLLSLTAGVLLLVGWVLESVGLIGTTTAVAFYVASLVFGGFDLVRQTAVLLARGRFEFDIDLLMLLAAAGASAIGEYAEGALLLFLFSLAHALEHYALGRARNAIAALGSLVPAYARVLREDGATDLVPVEEVAVGATVLVRPGERVPVDGRVARGTTAVDQAPITGESIPVDKAPGDEVFAGTVNGEGAIEVITTRATGDRTLDRIITLVAEAQTQKAPTQLLTERFERVFVPVVLLADALIIVVPPLAGWWDWSTSIYTGMATLVAASPCALALGTPASVLAGTAQAARQGVLIKGGVHLEQLAVVRALAVDKTGTITTGRPEVTDIVAIEGSGTETLRMAAAVERQSQHPLAAAVVRRAEAEGVMLPAASPMESVTARGVRAIVDGETVEIGSLRMWDDDAIPASVRGAVEALQRDGRSVMAVRSGARWLGVIGLADRPRAGVDRVIGRLRELGVQPIVMLTGDNVGVGEAVAREVGIDDVRGNLLPEEKVEAIRALRRRHGTVAMVGDGVNDAPALAQATVGIAMGAAGTAAALEAADVALMNDDLGQLVYAIRLARRTRAIIRQNIAIALTVIVLLMLATISGVAGLGVAVAFHEGSTLVVIANALRLLGNRSRRAE